MFLSASKNEGKKPGKLDAWLLFRGRNTAEFIRWEEGSALTTDLYQSGDSKMKRDVLNISVG